MHLNSRAFELVPKFGDLDLKLLLKLVACTEIYGIDPRVLSGFLLEFLIMRTLFIIIECRSNDKDRLPSLKQI